MCYKKITLKCILALYRQNDNLHSVCNKGLFDPAQIKEDPEDQSDVQSTLNFHQTSKTDGAFQDG